MEARRSKQEVGRNESDAGLLLKKDGTPKNTLENCIRAICHSPQLRNMFRHNLLTDEIEVSEGVWWERYSPSLTETDVNNIRLYLEEIYDLSSENGVPRAIDIIAHQKSYHPIRECLNSLVWDGKDRVADLLPKYLGATKCRYTTEATKLLLMGAICRVFQPGIKFDTTICLADPAQGGGKSTLCRFLAIKDEWFCDDIRDLDSNGAFEKLKGHWIIELSEMLATSNTKTVEAVKSFLSRQKDTYRVPYERYSRDFLRQNVFVGTSNALDFLPDDKSGNRRFIPIQVDKNKAKIHPLANEKETRYYILQCWAEMMELYRKGDYSLSFPDDMQEELKEKQRKYAPDDTRIGVIQEWLDKYGGDSVCTRMIWAEAFGNEGKEPKNYELRDISQIINTKIAGWKKHDSKDGQLRFDKYGKQRAWVRVPAEVSTKVSTKCPQGGMVVDKKEGCGQGSGQFIPVDYLGETELPFM